MLDAMTQYGLRSQKLCQCKDESKSNRTAKLLRKLMTMLREDDLLDEAKGRRDKNERAVKTCLTSCKACKTYEDGPQL